MAPSHPIIGVQIELMHRQKIGQNSPAVSDQPHYALENQAEPETSLFDTLTAECILFNEKQRVSSGVIVCQATIDRALTDF